MRACTATLRKSLLASIFSFSFGVLHLQTCLVSCRQRSHNSCAGAQRGCKAQGRQTQVIWQGKAGNNSSAGVRQRLLCVLGLLHMLVCYRAESDSLATTQRGEKAWVDIADQSGNANAMRPAIDNRRMGRCIDIAAVVHDTGVSIMSCTHASKRFRQ